MTSNVIIASSKGMKDKAFDWGSEFESRVKSDSELMGVTCVRVPNEIRALYSGRPIQIKTPFDYSLAIDRQAIYIETKAYQGYRFQFALVLKEDTIKDGKKSKGNIHQYRALLDASKNALAGYLIYFYELRQYFFLEINLMAGLIERGVKGISFDELDSLGIRHHTDQEPINFKYLFKID